jgi:C1A family cysteine protease
MSKAARPRKTSRRAGSRSAPPSAKAGGRGRKRHYGGKPDLPDRRDYMYAAASAGKTLPRLVDLRDQCPSVYRQGKLNCCTGNAIAAAIAFDQRLQGIKQFRPSRLFIYYNERVLEGTVNEDAGARIRHGIKAVAKLGAPPEPLWPYHIKRFADRPSRAAYAAAKKDLVTAYFRVPQKLSHMRACLAEGFPFVFGFLAAPALESAKVARSGVLPMPRAGDKPIGHHVVLAVGYDDSKRRFIVRNSWGRRWGKKGYYFMPYDYLTRANLSSDFWTLRSVTSR